MTQFPSQDKKDPNSVCCQQQNEGDHDLEKPPIVEPTKPSLFYGKDKVIFGTILTITDCFYDTHTGIQTPSIQNSIIP